MKISISQRELTIRGITYDCLEHGWHRLFSNHNIYSIPNVGVYNLDDTDLLVMSGGDCSANREITELHCYRQAVERNIPILGVCHGAFWINRHLGGIVDTISGHDNVDHIVTLEGNEQVVNSYHRVHIKTLADDLIPVAVDQDNNIEAYKHNTKNIWGLVWHPERMVTPVLPSDIKKLIYG